MSPVPAGPAGGRRRRPRPPGPTTRSGSTAATPLADPRSPRQPYGPDGASRTYDHAAFGWTDAALARRAGERRGDLRAAHRHVHPGGDAGRRHRAARLPGVARRHRGGADAGRRVPRRARLGLRRDRPVGRARALRRAGRAEAVRGRLPRPRSRRLPRRGLQPRRPGQPARLASARTSPTSTRPRGGRRSTWTSRGSDEVRVVHRRQRADVAARLPPRRAAARRGARVPGPPRGAHPRGARASRWTRCPPPPGGPSCWSPSPT